MAYLLMKLQNQWAQGSPESLVTISVRRLLVRSGAALVVFAFLGAFLVQVSGEALPAWAVIPFLLYLLAGGLLIASGLMSKAVPFPPSRRTFYFY